MRSPKMLLIISFGVSCFTWYTLGFSINWVIVMNVSNSSNVLNAPWQICFFLNKFTVAHVPVVTFMFLIVSGNSSSTLESWLSTGSAVPAATLIERKFWCLWILSASELGDMILFVFSNEHLFLKAKKQQRGDQIVLNSSNSLVTNELAQLSSYLHPQHPGREHCQVMQ